MSQVILYNTNTHVNQTNTPGQALSGRYVIVQMDNGEGVPLSLKEVRSYGIKGETPRKEGSFNFLEIGWYRFNRRNDERQWLSAGYAWHSRPRTTTLSSNLRNGGDESG